MAKSRRKKKYCLIPDPVDRQLFANDVLRMRIQTAKILRLASLPPWVSNSLKRIINRATNLYLNSRYQTASEMIAALGNVKSTVFDWYVREGSVFCLYPHGQIRLLPCVSNGMYRVEKNKCKRWRREEVFGEANLVTQVRRIMARYAS